MVAPSSVRRTTIESRSASFSISARWSRHASVTRLSRLGKPSIPSRSAGGKYVPPKKGRPSEVRNIDIGQPPCPKTWSAAMYTWSTSGRSSRSTLTQT
jgi:hypothetical protein